MMYPFMTLNDDTEMAYFKQLIRNNAHLIIEFSQEGGILNAANS